ncbi:MAG: NADH-quinone oxidoreductase subunit NuoE [Spirochaetia bacterium]|nr:NADH-quinone oxidoreductase subunit NuoE [Spirochaetia bacterium]
MSNGLQEVTEYSFSKKSDERFKELEKKFPEKNSLVLWALHLVQEDIGYVPEVAMEYVAQKTGVSKSWVSGVVTFYSMYNKKPVGKYHLQVCHNVSCWLNGSDKLEEAIKRKLNIEHGETTNDGKFTFSHVECLASCGTSPVVQVNNDYHEKMTPEKLEELIDELKQK